MKSLLLFILFILSLPLLAQSYLIMENGIIITFDKSGYAYDLGHYTYPDKVTLRGGRYFVEENSILVTVDEKGLLFRKYEQIPGTITGRGINYFISSEGIAYTIDRRGYLKFFESSLFRNVANFGGNYFSVSLNDEHSLFAIYVVTDEGEIKMAEALDLKVQDIVTYGGNYLMTRRGVVYTVGADGNISSFNQIRVGLIQKRGGNYFVDSSGFFYTISDQGMLSIPNLPSRLRVSTLLKFGTQYVIDQSGKLFVIGSDGNVFEKEMRDHDFRWAKIISL